MEDGVVVPEEVDLVDAERMCAYFLDDIFDDLIAASLNRVILTAVLLTTLTFLRWLPFPPVRASPTLSLSFWMLA